MSNKLQPVRGTHDILPDEFEKFSAVVNTARDLATLYGFREMATPIFEATEVFSRSMGETSDVVSKEMFTFDTRGGESVTLRPEFTAGIARAFISNGMQQNLPLKIFSTGPLFRYERPQKGRQRQFHQVNFEWLGDDSWQADVEVILVAGQLLTILSGGNKGCTLHINTLGDAESREKYKTALVNYLSPFSSELSEDSKRRLNTNPLRILDSKDSSDRKILVDAPVMTEYLSATVKERFDKICNTLKDNDIPVIHKILIDPSLVRGLDYYSGIVFEFVSNNGELGAQNTVLAGGRYDGLIDQMGGRATPAIGFAAGVERLLLLNSAITPKPRVSVIMIPFEEIRMEAAFIFATSVRLGLYRIFNQERLLRNFSLSLEIYHHGSVSKRLEKAVKNGATHVIMLPPDEIDKKKCILKNIATREENTIDIMDFIDSEKLKKIFNIV